MMHAWERERYWGYGATEPAPTDVKVYVAKVDLSWYAYAASDEYNEVYSIGKDETMPGDIWAGYTANGITRVATSQRTRAQAIAKAKRAATSTGLEYGGEVDIVERSWAMR